MNKYIAMCFALISLSACGDGVPELKDPANPINADGKAMTTKAFLDKYCLDKPINKTCVLVARAVSISSLSGPPSIRY